VTIEKVEKTDQRHKELESRKKEIAGQIQEILSRLDTLHKSYTYTND